MDISPNKEPEKEIKRKKRNRDTEEIPKKKNIKKKRKRRQNINEFPLLKNKLMI